MIICENCFCDNLIISIIRSGGRKGECQVCGGKAVYIYDTDDSGDLSGMFDELISIYTPISMLPKEFPKSETKLLRHKLMENWNIFNKRSQAEVYNIIVNLCSDKYRYMPEIFDQPIGLKELYSEEYLRKHSMLRTNTWSDFVTSLTKRNRFHTSIINLELLKKFCSYIWTAYKKGQKFFRCRISSAEGLSKELMGPPPSYLATEGRANALGISCLYLGDSIDTTIHEVRAGAFDYVSIGTFKLKEDIIIVDLKSIDKIDAFAEGLDFLEHAVNKENLKRINEEMGKALRKSDSVIDYVPTQYITDFIKSIENENKQVYAGIEYKSVMHAGGYNLAIFDADLFDCVAVNTYKIEGLSYSKNLVEQDY